MLSKQNSPTFKTTSCFQAKLFWMHYQNQLVVSTDLIFIYRFDKNLFSEGVLPTLWLNTEQFIMLPRMYSKHVHMCAGSYSRS